MDRATSPVVGTVLLIALTVIAAASVGVAVTASTADPPPSAAIETTADPETNEITVTHRGGDTIDVSELSVHITIDGQPLAEQPPVPFFAALGFVSGPGGPFNAASPDEFRAGQTATIQLATTNDPLLSPGSTVTVEFRTDDTVIARATTTAR
jgi:flagellin-like protein